MPEQDIYSGINPKAANQTEADYNSYLDSIGNERLSIVNDNSLRLFRENAKGRLAALQPAVKPVNNIPIPFSNVSTQVPLTIKNVTAPPTVETSKTDTNQIATEWAKSIGREGEYERMIRQQAQADRQNAIAQAASQKKNEQFLNEVSYQSPNLRRQAELEYNKNSVKKQKNNSLQETVSLLKQQNPQLDDVTAYQQAVGMQASKDQKVYEDIKRIPKGAFDQIVSKSQLLKSVSGDDDELDYLNSDKFKYDVYTASNGNPKLMPDMAKEITERRKLEKENAPNKIAEIQKGFYDVLSNVGNAGSAKGMPFAKAPYTAGIFAGKALQTMVKLGAAGASGLGAMDDNQVMSMMASNPALAPILPFIAGNNQLSESEKKGGFLSRFGQIYNDKNKTIEKYIPEAKSATEAERGFESTVYDASRLMGELSAVGVGPEFKVGTKFLGRSLNASKAADLSSAYGQLLARGGTARTINTASNLTKALSSAPANMAARYVDNYLGVLSKFGPIVYDGYYQSALDKGFTPEEAAKKAAFQSGVNAAAFSLISPFKSGYVPKNLRNVLGQGSIGKNLTDAAVQFAKDAGIVGAEGTIAITADAYQDFLDAKEQGIIPKDQPFDYASAIKDGINTLPATALAIATGRLVNSHGILAKPEQAWSIGDAITNRDALDMELRKSISKGMPVREAAKLNGFLDVITPYVQEAQGMTDVSGNPFSKEQAVQYGIERAKLSESSAKLLDVQKRMENAESADPVLQSQEIKYKEQVEKSARALEQLEKGEYTKGQLLSADELLGRNAVDETRATDIEDNGPYESETIRIEDVANDPVVQQRIAELEANPDLPRNSGEPVVIDETGKVISGHDSIAESIINGDITIDSFRSTAKDKISSIVSEDITGEVVNKEGLDRDQSRILDEIKSVFDKAKSSGTTDEALQAAANDILERGYTKEQGIDQLLRLTNGEISNPVAEYFYNTAYLESVRRQNEESKRERDELREKIAIIEKKLADRNKGIDIDPLLENVPQQTIEQPTESQLTIEEIPEQNGLSDITTDRVDPVPTEGIQTPAVSQEAAIENKAPSLESTAYPKIEEVFKNNTEISSIGTPEQYAEYLSTIFPDSKLRDIVYHRSNEKFDDFDFSKVNKDTGGGFDFATESGATKYGKNLYPVLLDIGEYKPSYERTSNRDGTTQPTMYDGDIYSVYNPEQIHILGSKADIAGFREFVNKNAAPKKVSFEFAGDLRNGEVVTDEGDNVRVRDAKGISYTIPKSAIVNDVAQTVRSYESVAGLTPQTTNGRIPVSPILGAEPKMLRDIIFDVTKGVKQRLFYAKPSNVRGALGTYSPGNSAIKIRFAGDLDTTAHELGHSMDDIFDIISYAKANPVIEGELKQFSQYGSTPPASHPNPADYALREGLAEWTRAFIVNPDQARIDAPEMSKLFESKVEKSYRDAIDGFSKDVRSFAGATGKDMVLSNVEWKPETKSTIDNVRDLIFNKSDPTNEFSVTWADRLSATFVNPLRAFEKAAEYAQGIKGIDNVLPADNPELLARLLLGVNGKTSQILESGMIDTNLNVLKDAKGNPKNLKWLLEPFANADKATIESEMKDAIAYMIAERTVELGKNMKREDVLTGIGGGLFKDVDVAQKALNEFQNDPQKLARIQEATTRYREMADDVLKYLVDKGRISQDVYNDIKANHTQYVALKRVAELMPNEDVVGFNGRGSTKIGSVSNPINAIKGSTKTISNPYLSLLDSIDRGVREADRNEVLRTFRDLLVSDRDMGQGEPMRLSDIGHKASQSDPNTIKIFVDGKPEFWQFEKDVYAALKGLNDEGYKFPKIITALPKLLRASVTNWPIFAIKNFIRDTQARMIMSNENNLGNLYGLKELYGDKEHWKEVERAGGLNAGLYMKDKAHYYGLMERAIDDISKKGGVVANGDILKKGWDGYKSMLSKSETSNRVAEYRSGFKKAKSQGMDDYNAQLYAAYRSRDLLDFALMGNFMKYMNQLVPFSNAAVQGARSTYNRAMDNPKSFAIRATLFSVLPSAALWMWNHRDEEISNQYEELPNYQKDMFYNIKIGPNNWLSIPKPYEVGLLGSGVGRSMSYANGNEDAYDGYAGTVAKSVFPLNEGNLAGPAQALVEVSTNHDYFKDNSIIPSYEQPLAVELRNTERASRLGKSIQSIAGMDARNVDHFIKHTTSYMGSTALKLSDLGREDVLSFNLSDLGLFKQSPAYNSVSVQEYMKYAAEYGLTGSYRYKEFKKLMKEYFDAKTPKEKEMTAKAWIQFSQSEVDDIKKIGSKKILEKERQKNK